ncbi:hypothetical protein [Amycolatopsis tucumanensis]|uniref:Uncharacterized protein n=1 Tax=Amycolatopsis tucumanensis TaxID=401106 RepID=A0ABP7JNN4_9PSEU|nr:hypothetical protein [Amycolatopsis tucumanensis]MCF6428886.1 hypothetical protein [Amycolatopsis tucumanensis]
MARRLADTGGVASPEAAASPVNRAGPWVPASASWAAVNNAPDSTRTRRSPETGSARAHRGAATAVPMAAAAPARPAAVKLPVASTPVSVTSSGRIAMGSWARFRQPISTRARTFITYE